MEKDVFLFFSSRLPFRQGLPTHTSRSILSFAVRERLPRGADCRSLHALSTGERDVHDNDQIEGSDCFGNALCHHVKHTEKNGRMG